MIDLVSVIDFGGTDKPSAQVRKIDILKFLDQNIGFVRFPHPIETCHPAKKVIELAESLLTNPKEWEPFGIIRKNCEHFATFCKTGESYCTQYKAIAYECIKHPLTTMEICSASSGCSCNSKKKYKMEFEMDEQK